MKGGRMQETVETVLIDYDTVLVDTGAGGASLFKIDVREVWIPNSLVEEVYKSEASCQVEIPVWFAKKEGLI